MNIIHHYTREELIGPSFWKFSDLGMVQFQNNYDQALLDTIRRKAIALKNSLSSPSCLSSSYIREPHKHIIEINELLEDKERIARLESFVGNSLEVYPLSIARCFIHFMNPNDGSLFWHSDAVPSLEIINLELSDVVGGEMQIYKGSEDEGRMELVKNGKIPEEKLLTVKPRLEYSVFGQFTRTLHRTRPIESGSRIALLIAYRSKEKPYIDDNTVWFLAADNPRMEWLDDFTQDIKSTKIPAYLRDKQLGVI
ncbi:MAG: hypothetical protein F6K54_20290 [Okeania sp. SIO3B5]|uniref:hypothetical protein n=1 Tax=Okeania sp. SIO3B5 TaxID=2607811 RepID=UPI001400EB77|nr:hypothetical protein [Okeania sp. SIO3B5]NEO55209.1 hypothetical protein [Okeania sp. SIO3B5]